MFRTILLFILLLSFVKSQSQPISFIKNYVFGEFSGLNGEVIQTHDSGYATLCYIDSGLSLIKSNAYGDTLWTRNYPITTDWNSKIAEKNGGGYYILYSNDCGAMFSCGAIISTDAVGNIIWSQTYNLGYATHLSKLIVGNENQIYLGGWVIYDITGDEDEVLLKLDSSGNINFSKIFLKTTFDRINSLRMTGNGDYYFISLCDSFPNNPPNYALVTRADSDGNIIWSTKIDSTSYLSPDLEVSSTNEVFTILQRPFSTGNSMAVVKLTSTGSIEWKKQYFSGYYSAIQRSITKSSAGNMAITGGIIDTVNNSYDHKIFFLLMDTAGNELTSSFYPQAYAGYCIYPTLDNGYIIGADDINSANMDPGFYLIKTNGSGEVLGGTELPSKDKKLKIFPNPSTGIVSIHMMGGENPVMDFEVLNSLGQGIEKFSASNSLAQLDLSNYPEGIYFLIGKDEFKSYLGKIIISR